MTPLVGITCDLAETPEGRLRAVGAAAYFDAVAAAGGVPVLLPPVAACAEEYVSRCDAIVLTGGQDPRMEPLGGITHPSAEPMHPRRQDFEFALLTALDKSRLKPALGVCLGMQLMSLNAGGALDQHLPDSLKTADRHSKDHQHRIEPVAGAAPQGGPIPAGLVASNHHQAVTNAGRLRVVARSEDGVIEAVDDPARPFYLGVQWHPERTPDQALGAGMFRRLIDAARSIKR